MSKEAMKLALEALECTEYPQDHYDAITALREALAAQQEPVACIIGVKGSAFDTPKTKRAYTYAEQPGNVVASKIGRACLAASNSLSGDSIDRGLSFLQELQKEGLGVFDLGAEYITPQPAPVAKPHEQDPVAIADGTFNHNCPVGTPLYTSPPAQRKPLTGEQREEIVKGWRGRNWTVGDIIDATESAHGIGEKK